MHFVSQAKRPRLLGDLAEIGTIPDHEQPCRHLAANPFEHVDDGTDAFDGPEVRYVITIFSCSEAKRTRSEGTSERRWTEQSRKLGMTRMSQLTPSSRRVSVLRLSDTAVTPSDCSMQNATVSEYDGSLPSRVMSVPCSVVMTLGGTRSSEDARICRARYAAVACGMA